MQAIHITKSGGSEVLQVQQIFTQRILKYGKLSREELRNIKKK